MADAPSQQEIVAQGPDGWDKLWQMNRTSWDKSGSSPVLLDLIKRGKIPAHARCLVPGCGRGYDVAALASVADDRTAVGLDLSPKAVAEANAYANSLVESGKMDAALKGRMSFAVGDFFKDSEVLQPRAFDVVYDYTFLCALHPDMRRDWARRMGELLKSGGVLVALIFPLQTAEPTGPPWQVSVELFHELLDDTFECLFIDDCDALSFESRRGREKISMWRRK